MCKLFADCAWDAETTRYNRTQIFVSLSNQLKKGYFQVAFCLYVKTNLREKPFISKCLYSSGSLRQKSNFFHMRGFARGLVLKQRHKVTQKSHVEDCL